MSTAFDDPFLCAAIAEAEQGRDEGGIPIGSVLVIDGRVVGRGHNRRVQKGSAILHAEMDALENEMREHPERYTPVFHKLIEVYYAPERHRGVPQF